MTRFQHRGEESTPLTLTLASPNLEQQIRNHRKTNQDYPRTIIYLEQLAAGLHAHRARGRSAHRGRSAGLHAHRALSVEGP
jgi:hypothetical protein